MIKVSREDETPFIHAPDLTEEVLGVRIIEYEHNAHIENSFSIFNH